MTNEADDTKSKPGSTRKPASALSLTSIVLPLIGLLIFLSGLAETSSHADYGRGAILGFFAWAGFGIAGGFCSIASLCRDGSNGIAASGLLFSAAPFITALFTMG